MRIQRKKIAAVIKRDCKLRGQYFGPHGATCVVGGLLVAAGVTRKQFRASGVWNSGGIFSLGEKYIEILGKVYGLSYNNLLTLQHTNDTVMGVDRRRASLLKRLEEIKA